MKKQGLCTLALLLAAFPAVPASPGAPATDAAKETRWAEQIVDALIDGEAVWLEAGGQRFLAIYTPPAGEPRGGVVLLHGMGAHPDWPEVVHPLRTGLPERGWATLSIQLPVLASEARPEDYTPLLDAAAPRIAAAVAWLRGKGHGPVALAGHSLGAVMGLRALAAGKAGRVAAFVAVGIPDRGWEVPEGLRRVKVPVLDLHGSLDLREVLGGARARLTAMAAAGAEGSRQVRVEGADHFFQGFEDELLARVDGWLRSVTGTGGH